MTGLRTGGESASSGIGKDSYNILRKTSIDKGHDLCPSYYELTKVKQNYLPPSDSITIQDHRVDVKLQASLDQTAKSIVKFMGAVLDETNLKLICKWGSDESGGHSMFKQRLGNIAVGGDSQMVMICFVPLQLVSDSGKVIWDNVISLLFTCFLIRKLVYNVQFNASSSSRSSLDSVPLAQAQPPSTWQ